MNNTQTVAEDYYRVKLIGVLGSSAGSREITLQAPSGLTLSGLISKLLDDVNRRQFTELLVDTSTNNPLPNVIILIDEHDCNLFQGLNTKLDPGTLVTIIPVAHGG